MRFRQGATIEQDDQPLTEKLKAKFAETKDQRQEITKQAVVTGRNFLMTPMGKAVLTGAIAGGAIGAALPFVSVFAGAAIGAGSLALIKGIKEAL